MLSAPDVLQLFSIVLPLHNSIVADIQSLDESAAIETLHEAIPSENLSLGDTSISRFNPALTEIESRTEMIIIDNSPREKTALNLKRITSFHVSLLRNTMKGGDFGQP
jgi:hypothetical protein